MRKSWGRRGARRDYRKGLRSGWTDAASVSMRRFSRLPRMPRSPTSTPFPYLGSKQSWWKTFTLTICTKQLVEPSSAEITGLSGFPTKELLVLAVDQCWYWFRLTSCFSDSHINCVSVQRYFISADHRVCVIIPDERRDGSVSVDGWGGTKPLNSGCGLF